MAVLRRLFLPAALAFAVVTPAAAQAPARQPDRPESIQVSLGLLVGVPTGEFGRNVDGAGGVAGRLDVGLGGSIVSVGGEASYLFYGNQSRKVDLGAMIPELPGAVVTLTTDNAMVLVHGRVRLQARRGRWRPYLDGVGGFNYIYTKTSIDESTCTGSGCYGGGIEATNLSDFVPSFGAGTGVMWDFGSPGGLRMDFLARYLWGGEADYLAEGAIRREGGQAVLDISRSRTDLFLLYVGISFGR